MSLGNMRPAAGATKTKKRRGKGSATGLGGTAGKGHKGHKARTGGKIPSWFEGGQMPIQRRMPKVGFRSAMKATRAEVRLDELAKVEGDLVDLAALLKAQVVPAGTESAKVILSGEIKKAVTLKGVGVTKGARAAIEAAGGKIEA